MKIWTRKQKTFIAAAVAGLMLLATSAYADIAGRTGYEKLKDAVRSTLENMAVRNESYTVTLTMQVTDNGVLVQKMESINKENRTANASERSVITSNSKGIVDQNYSYNDNQVNIWYDRYQDVYTLSRKVPGPAGPVRPGEGMPDVQPTDISPETNAFEQGARDVERIIDAVVGNLKDNVLAVEKSDGSMTITGSLSEMQIPPLVNALASFAYKQAQPGMNQPETVSKVNEKGEAVTVEQNRLEYPVMVNDLYLRRVEGTAEVDPAGTFTSLLAGGTVSGLDQNGKLHDLEVEIRMQITGVNATVLVPPDLTGKNVREYTDMPGETFVITSRYAGTYVQDIVELREDRFVKVGERRLIITRAEASGVSGSYLERYQDGTKAEWGFSFEGKKTYDLGVEFPYVDLGGVARSGTINFDASAPELMLFLTTGDPDIHTAYPEKSRKEELLRFRLIFE